MSFKTMLNKVCDIEHLSLSSQTANGQRIEEWREVYSDIPCRLRTRKAGEKRFSSPEYQHADYSLYMDYIKLPKGRLRVKINGEYYLVGGRLCMGGAEKYFCLYLEEKLQCT